MNGETIHICLHKPVIYGGAVLKITHGLYPGFSPDTSLNAPPCGLLGFLCQRAVFYPGIQKLCKSLCILFITSHGICLSQAYKELVAVELKDKLRVISRHVVPIHFLIKVNRLIGSLHIPPQIKQKRMLHCIICNAKDMIHFLRPVPLAIICDPRLVLKGYIVVLVFKILFL